MTINLTPTAIIDRNGKRNTVHKRNAPVGNASKTLAGVAPTLGGSLATKKAASSFKPLAKQLEAKPKIHNMYTSMIDDGLLPLLGSAYKDRDGSYKNMHQQRVSVSDVEGYGVFSVVDGHQTALALMGLGLKSADETREFLEENNLGHLIVENEERMQGALSRRIPLEKFIEFESGWAGTDKYPDTYLDAAEASSYKSLEKVSGLVHDISKGNISWQDIKDAGIATITRSEYPYGLSELFQKIHSGEANYTAKQLGSILKASKGTAIGEHLMLQMMKNYGGEAAASIRDVRQVENMREIAKADKPSKDEMQSIIMYANEFHQPHRYMHHSYIYELYKAGVPADFAVENNPREKPTDVREIIGLYQGTAPAVLDGWL